MAEATSAKHGSRMIWRRLRRAMTQHRKPRAKYWVITAVAISAFTIVSVLIAYVGMPRFGVTPGVLLMVAALLLLVRWHASTTAYRCKACGNEFQISFREDLLTPHVFSAKYVRCPACGHRGWSSAMRAAP